jgi:hypothetical protein
MALIANATKVKIQQTTNKYLLDALAFRSFYFSHDGSPHKDFVQDYFENSTFIEQSQAQELIKIQSSANIITQRRGTT